MFCCFISTSTHNLYYIQKPEESFNDSVWWLPLTPAISWPERQAELQGGISHCYSTLKITHRSAYLGGFKTINEFCFSHISHIGSWWYSSANAFLKSTTLICTLLISPRTFQKKYYFNFISSLILQKLMVDSWRVEETWCPLVANSHRASCSSVFLKEDLQSSTTVQLLGDSYPYCKQNNEVY